MRKNKGFTIIELLVSLAITAMLMTAVAIAFNASAMSYSDNRQMYESLNNARMSLTRITTQLRTAKSVNPFEDSSQCSFQADDGKFLMFRYDAANKKLLINSDSKEYTLCENVSAMAFSRQTGVIGGVTYVKGVQITMTVGSGRTAEKIATAVSLQKTL